MEILVTPWLLFIGSQHNLLAGKTEELLQVLRGESFARKEKNTEKYKFLAKLKERVQILLEAPIWLSSREKTPQYMVVSMVMTPGK